MSYEPTNWKDGDLVTSAKLNKLEQGVAAGGGITFVEMDMETETLNKTWQEIYDAAKSGVVYLKLIRENNSGPSKKTISPAIGISNTILNNPLIVINYNENSLPAYLVKFNDITESATPTTFYAESADDYPGAQTEPAN